MQRSKKALKYDGPARFAWVYVNDDMAFETLIVKLNEVLDGIPLSERRHARFRLFGGTVSLWQNSCVAIRWDGEV